MIVLLLEIILFQMRFRQKHTNNKQQNIKAGEQTGKTGKKRFIYMDPAITHTKIVPRSIFPKHNQNQATRTHTSKSVMQTQGQNSHQIKMIKTTRSSRFNIIQTQTNDYYYSPNDDPKNPIKIQQPTLTDTSDIFIPDKENNEYWAYNSIFARERLYLYHRHQEIYQFEEPALSHKEPNQYYLNFHVLDNRWVVVIILSADDKTIICRTHDLQKRKNSQSHLLAELHVKSADDIYTYSVDNKIIIITPWKIAMLGIQPDCGGGFTSIDFKHVANLINTSDIKWFSSQLLVKKVSSPAQYQQPEEDSISAATHLGTLLNIYYQAGYRPHSEHCLNDIPVLLGTINPDTLEVKCYYSQPKITECMMWQQFLLPGKNLEVFECLAPDIIIHRPDVSKPTQYLTLLLPDHADSAHPKQIRTNIHDFEPYKEQRKYKCDGMFVDDRVFTIIYTKYQDNTWTIYQVDRNTQTIIHMIIPKPKQAIPDFHIEIQASGRIRIYKFNIFRETIRIVCPSTDNLVALLTGVPEPVAHIIGKFAKQKIINY